MISDFGIAVARFTLRARVVALLGRRRRIPFHQRNARQSPARPGDADLRREFGFLASNLHPNRMGALERRSPWATVCPAPRDRSCRGRLLDYEYAQGRHRTAPALPGTRERQFADGWEPGTERLQ